MYDGCHARFYRDGGREFIEISPIFNPTLVAVRLSTPHDRESWHQEYGIFRRSEQDMAAEVQEVVFTFKEQMEEIKKVAVEASDMSKKVGAHLKETLGMVHAHLQELDDMDREIRNYLGAQTNNPPPEAAA